MSAQEAGNRQRELDAELLQTKKHSAFVEDEIKKQIAEIKQKMIEK